MPENPKTGRWRAGHRRARSRLEPLAGVLAGGDTATGRTGGDPDMADDSARRDLPL